VRIEPEVIEAAEVAMTWRVPVEARSDRVFALPMQGTV